MNTKFITAGLCLWLGGQAMASVYYLHENMPLGSSPLDNTLWFTDPVGGIDKATDGGTFGGNRFNLNGKNLRTQSLPGIGKLYEWHLRFSKRSCFGLTETRAMSEFNFI